VCASSFLRMHVCLMACVMACEVAVVAVEVVRCGDWLENVG